MRGGLFGKTKKLNTEIEISVNEYDSGKYRNYFRVGIYANVNNVKLHIIVPYPGTRSSTSTGV